MTRVALVLLVLAIAPFVAGGCGQKFELPPQPTAEPTPEAGRYAYDKTWSLPAPRDLAIRGAYLYVITGRTGGDPADSALAEIQVFLTDRPDPTPPPQGRFHPFTGLKNPVRLCVAQRESTYVFVADQGDMRIKRYHFTGGSPRASFGDSAWKSFTGLAADNQLNVYVADAARDTIAQYDETGAMVRLISSWGAGSGFVMRPHGLEWNGYELLVGDTDQDRVVLLRTDATETASGDPVGLDPGGPHPIEPLDVAGDRERKFLFVAERSHGGRVLKYLRNGTFVDSVYSAVTVDPRLPEPIRDPRYVAAEGRLVFVSDSLQNRLVAFTQADSL